MGKRLGQEEHLNKELAIMNNKLQNNLGDIRQSAKDRYADFPEDDTFGRGKPNFYAAASDDLGEDSLNERKRAWEELDRESEEVKRKIRSHMRQQPESLVIDNPLQANRVS